MFSVENISYRYDTNQGIFPALTEVSLQIPAGQWWGIVGANGSGKSTLARHLNGLLLPEQGRVFSCGLDTAREENLVAIRRKVGFVFQNPDNQMVGNTVEEDVSFGLENAGVPQQEMRRRIETALAAVGLPGMEKRDPVRLSGGQKQRLAIAGALVMEPEALILDESTAMLDGEGRQDILALLTKLHHDGMTIIMISHDMEEAMLADCLAVMDKGRLVATGRPREIFARMAQGEQWDIDLPEVSRIGSALADLGMEASFRDVLTVEEMVAKLCP